MLLLSGLNHICCNRSEVSSALGRSWRCYRKICHGVKMCVPRSAYFLESGVSPSQMNNSWLSARKYLLQSGVMPERTFVYMSCRNFCAQSIYQYAERSTSWRACQSWRVKNTFMHAWQSFFLQVNEASKKRVTSEASLSGYSPSFLYVVDIVIGWVHRTCSFFYATH